MKQNKIKFKSGFVAIVGAPNAGKSTFLNKVLGKKISITSRKPQTTRNRIFGILNRKNLQVVFIDTPGIHSSKKNLNKRIVETAFTSIVDVDVIFFIVDVLRPDIKSEQLLIDELKKHKNVILALNKIDLLKKEKVAEIFNEWVGKKIFNSIFPISSKHNIGIEDVLNKIEDFFEENPAFFPQDAITDVSDSFLISEIIREKVFRLTGQEVPYSVAVTIDAIFDKKRGIVEIHATIHTERQSQKGIIIGKQGTKLKEIGTQARIEIEKLINSKVLLKLFVRVQKNWSDDTKSLNRFGY